jgi:RNA polymerase sigma-B factor
MTTAQLSQATGEAPIGAAARSADPNELFRRWQRDDDQLARERLVERYMPLARKLARRYMGAREPFDDLTQVASLGLIKAIDRFDYERGIAFSSFAVPTILGELKRYFRDSGWSVHVPRSAQERALKIEAAQRKLAALDGRSPTVGELAEYMELSIEEVVDSLEASAAHPTVSFETPRDDADGEGGTLADGLGSEDARFEQVDAGATIGAAAQSLDERERRVLALRFLEDRTQTEIAELVGVSQMQVSRIIRRSVARVREIVGEEAASS